MEAPIIIALIGGFVGTAGSILRLLERFTDRKPTEGRLSLDRDVQVNQEIWRYVEELKKDRDEVRELAAETAKGLQAEVARVNENHQKLQSLYHLALERIDSLESGRESDQRQILGLQSKLRQLEASTE